MKLHVDPICSTFRAIILFFCLFLTIPTHAIHDTNQNAVSDLWERKNNNGNLMVDFDPTADPDGDGWTNEQEAVTGTNPFNGNAPGGFIRPHIEYIPAVYITPEVEGGEPEILSPEITTITWPTLAGKLYTLFASTDLSPGSWTTIGTPNLGSGNEIAIAISLSQSDGGIPERLFLRVSVLDIDHDSDTLTNAEEAELGSLPYLADGDNDGLNDLEELFTYQTNPVSRDSDGDGVSDPDEILVNFTNPLTAADADGDGIPDDFEKYFAKQLLVYQADSSAWGTHHAGLVAGNLNATYDYTGDGMSVRELAEILKKIAAAGPAESGYHLEQQGRRNSIPWAYYFSSSSSSSSSSEGIYSHSVPNDYDVRVSMTPTADLSSQYLLSRIDGVSWSGSYITPGDQMNFFNRTVESAFQSTPVMSPNGTKFQGHISQQRSRLIATTPGHETYSRSYLKVIENSNYFTYNHRGVITVEPITVEVPKGKMLSDWYEFKAPVVSESDGRSAELRLLPVEVAVDADRDGEITFDGKDKTTFQKPYRFWVNDDRDIQNDVDDGDSEEDDVDSFANDCDQPGLEYSRDLEDLMRLWIDFSGISQVFPASDPTVALKVRIQSESGDPRFTFFQPVESDGGKQYLKDEATGSSQLQGSYGQELCRVAGTSSVEIPRRAWETLPSNKVVHLLFEGAKAGDAELIFEIWKDGEKVCDLPTVHIVLKKADDMYETWTVGDVVNEGVDYTKWPAATFSQTTGQDLPAPEKPEEKDYIMLVHGWNMPPWEKETYGSTMFKRMWHQGYKGRFGMFRWPTFHGFEGDFEDLTQDPDHFNASELRAWNSASRLKALIENRAAVFGSDKIRLYAHSMGNIVCGEALRQFGPSGASVHSYIAAQAAISSHSYDKTTPARKPAYQLEMPNVYGYYWQQGASDWPPQWEMDGRPSYMNTQYLPGNVAYINHYNFDDYALNGTRWPLNQDLKPGFNYHYTFQGLVGGYSDYRFIRGPRYNQTILNVPEDRYEIFSNAADSAANALGKVGTTGGKFSESVNVAPLLVYDTHPEAHKYHSGQFRSTVQKRWEYWKLALENMKTATPAQ